MRGRCIGRGRGGVERHEGAQHWFSSLQCSGLYDLSPCYHSIMRKRHELFLDPWLRSTTTRTTILQAPHCVFSPNAVLISRVEKTLTILPPFSQASKSSAPFL
jgi:hypothetical protein